MKLYHGCSVENLRSILLNGLRPRGYTKSNWRKTPSRSDMVYLTAAYPFYFALSHTGIVAVVAGVFLIAGGPALFRAVRDPARQARVGAGIRYGLATGVFIAAYTVVDGWGVKALGMSPILVDYVGNLVRIAILAPLIVTMRTGLVAVWRVQWKGALLVAAVSPVSYVLVLYAMQQAPLSHVAPAREVSMLFAALLGGHLLAEGDRLARFLGAACIAAGVMALALG